jgi:choline dehydrogenase-like flavoprotein
VQGLFVSDGSLFPTSLGGPPQISIYSFALHLAPNVIARARS